MATTQKKVEIIFDINGKPIDVAVQSTLNFKQQVKALNNELAQLSMKGKENSAEFKLLSSKLNETKDNADRVNAKSRELFGTLSLLPGPIGQFASGLQSSVDLLKTFSGYKLSDIKSQFAELGKDISHVFDNILGINKAIKETPQVPQQGGTTTTGGGTTTAVTATGGGTTTAVAATNDVYQKQVDIKKVLVFQNGQLISKEQAMINASQKSGQAIAKMTVEEQALYMQQRKTTLSTEQQSTANEALAASEEVATATTGGLTIALNLLKLALSGLGIGLIIAGFMKLYDVVSEFITGAKAAAKENELLEGSFKALQNGIKETEDVIKNNTQIALNDAKLRNASVKEQVDIEKKGLKDRVQANKDALTALQHEQTKLLVNSTITEEQRKERQKEIDAAIGENSKKAGDLRLEQQLAESNASLTLDKDATDRRLKQLDAQIAIENDKEKTSADKLQKLYDEQLQIKKSHEQLSASEIVQIKEENRKKIIAAITEDATRLVDIQTNTDNAILVSLKQGSNKYYETKKALAKDTYDREVKQAELDEKTKASKLLLAKATYDKAVNDIDEEQVKFKQTITSKISEIEISAIKEDTTKQKLERQKKYDDEKIDLDNLFKDKLIEEKDYQIAVINMNQALVNDLKKIDDDKKKKDNEEKLKKLDDDIKFLQISTDAEKNSFLAYWDDRQKLLDKEKERELSELDLTEAQKLAIEKKYVQLSKDLQKEKFDAYLGYVSAGLGAVSNFYSQQQTINGLALQNELNQVKGNAEAEDKVKEKYFYKNRQAQKGQAIISTLQSAISAYSSLAVIPVVGPVLGAIAAAAALVFGYKQVDLIAGQTYQSSLTGGSSAPSSPAAANYGKNYGDGGMIEGPRHAGGGVMINAEGGEAVMTRGAVTMFAPLLSAMNQMGGGTSFSKGAMGQANNDHPKTTSVTPMAPQIIKTYVVSSELTTEAQKQARLKDLSTL
jgi:hypothetical protein